MAAADEDQKDSRSRPAADNVDVHRSTNNQTEARVTKSQNKIQLVRTRSTGRDRVSKDADGGDEDHRTKVGTSVSQAVAADDEDQIDSRSRTAADDVDVHRNPNNQNEARVTTNQNKLLAGTDSKYGTGQSFQGCRR